MSHSRTSSFTMSIPIQIHSVMKFRTECEHGYFVFFCSLLCEDEKQAVTVKSQLQQLARPMYSNPPLHGAQMVSTILGDPELKSLWLKEVKVTTFHHRLVIYSMFQCTHQLKHGDSHLMEPLYIPCSLLES